MLFAQWKTCNPQGVEEGVLGLQNWEEAMAKEEKINTVSSFSHYGKRELSGSKMYESTSLRRSKSVFQCVCVMCYTETQLCLCVQPRYRTVRSKSPSIPCMQAAEVINSVYSRVQTLHSSAFIAIWQKPCSY